ELARRGGRRAPVAVASREAAEAEIAAVARLGARLVAWGEPEYPAALAAIADPPPLIVVLGHAHLLSRPSVAIVGARNASANGVRIARRLAGDLGRAGFIVVSGLARGIDAAAHQGALGSGTIALQAGGIDIAYPAENQALHAAIAEAGALVSEQPPGTQPQARHFPRRNRLVSGLARGTVVVEAAARSGSLITARLALEQGREVFAVPGSPLDPRARGTNDLLRQGAILTESADDIVQALAGAHTRRCEEGGPPAPEGGPPPGLDEAALSRGRGNVLARLSPSPVEVDELLRQCDVSPPILLMVLLELELAGRLQRYPGNQVSLLLEAA
ncbi:MAG: DNA-protecting protein DprA, partial [Alphaproteobacteria bacterium]|nr:DNA-protecting protein DprA [Alphaproteobacteria bacterium]